MSARHLTSLALAAALLSGLAGAARAEPAAAPATPATSAGAAATSGPRLRASHRIDVIAPGEAVDSVIDRMRAGQANPRARHREDPVASARPGVKDRPPTAARDDPGPRVRPAHRPPGRRPPGSGAGGLRAP